MSAYSLPQCVIRCTRHVLTQSQLLTIPAVVLCLWCVRRAATVDIHTVCLTMLSVLYVTLLQALSTPS
jgi:hypothetical protein